jgi:dTDP-4-amino-4,6-dideoxygalactose transaminase
MADMPALMDIARHYDLPVVEDAACALGATLDGRQAGTWGSMGCFSFHPRKAITTGEGGMVVTEAPDLARRLRALRNHGQDPEAVSTDFIVPGFNYRLTEIQAALGVTQMARLATILSRRREVAERYNTLLVQSPLQAPQVRSGSVPVYQSYVVLLPPDLASQRSAMIQHLKKQGIETTIGTWHMPLSSYFRSRYGYREGDFPVTDQVFQRSLTLPLYEQLSASDQTMVVDRLHELLALHTGAAS